MSKYKFYIYSDNFYVLIREKKMVISAYFNKNFILIYNINFLYKFNLLWVKSAFKNCNSCLKVFLNTDENNSHG